MGETSPLSHYGEGTKTANKKEVKASEEVLKIESTSNSERDLQLLRSRLCLLQYSLEEQRITSNYLREERDQAVNLNKKLQRELKVLRKGVFLTRKTRTSCESSECKQSGSYQPGIYQYKTEYT